MPENVVILKPKPIIETWPPKGGGVMKHESTWTADEVQRTIDGYVEMVRKINRMTDAELGVQKGPLPPFVRVAPPPVPGIIETTRVRTKPRIRVKAGSRRWPGPTPALREAYRMYREATE